MKVTRSRWGMQRVSFAVMECPIARAADQLGDGWSMLVLRNAFLGVRTFQDFEQQLGIPTSTLTRRLKLLCKQGLLARIRYHDRPPRDEYVLTDKGRDLLPVLLTMAAWGNRWLAPKGAPLLPLDAHNGEELLPIVIDKHTRRELVPGSVAIGVGPGASKRLRSSMPSPRPFGARRMSDEQEGGR